MTEVVWRGKRAGDATGLAVQFVGPITFGGVPYPPGTWVVRFPTQTWAYPPHLFHANLRPLDASDSLR